MPKIKRPRIAGPAYNDEREEAPAPPRAAVRARDVPYSVAWFRDRVATYALGTIICGAAMLTLAAWMGGSLGAFGQRMNAGFNVIAGWTGLAVRDVHVNTEVDPLMAEKVKAFAQINIGDNMLGADPYVIRDRLERIDSIGAVSVQRLWPNTIDIHVEQRQPVALWQDNLQSATWRVIDQRGRTFAEADPGKYVHLPRVVGEDAAEAAAALVTAMAEFPNLADRMEIAYRIGARRWDVKFKGRSDVVAFPDDSRLVEQLDALNLMQAQNRVLDLPATRIDARHPKYIALQPMPGAPEIADSPGGA
jgi:cell division protein FtsQ